MKKRFLSEFKKIFAILIIGMAYYIFLKTTHIFIPCVFRLITGKLCPGCGITHMLISVFKGDFYSAYGYNKLLFITLPIIILIIIFEEIRYIKSGVRKLTKISSIILYFEIFLLILFGILRNIF